MNLPSRSPARRRPTPLLAAVVLIAALTATALAAFGGGPVGLVFPGNGPPGPASPWGNPRRPSSTPLTQRVDQSVTAEGVTVTADSITVGSDSLWVLLRVTGASSPPPKPIPFRNSICKSRRKRTRAKPPAFPPMASIFWALTRAAHCSFCSNTRPVYPAKPNWATGRIS